VRPDPDDGGLRNYLLGLLPETDAEALEEAYLARPEVWERVRGVEDDLLDDYASDRLAPGEKTAFEERYLASAPLRARVTAARALRGAMASGSRAPASRVTISRPARWTTLAVAAGLFLAFVAVWMWRPIDRPPAVPATHPPVSAVRVETPLPLRIPPMTEAVLAVSPILLRGQEQPVELRIPPGTDTIVLELEGDPAVLPRSTSALEAYVKTVEGAAVWRGEASRVVDTARPSLLATARVPRERFTPGDYVVTLSAPGTDAPLSGYFLRVKR
jgi:hypothetical protein